MNRTKTYLKRWIISLAVFICAWAMPVFAGFKVVPAGPGSGMMTRVGSYYFGTYWKNNKYYVASYRNADGSGMTPLFSPVVKDSYYSILTDGKKVYYTTLVGSSGTKADICSVMADGKGKTRIARVAGGVQYQHLVGQYDGKLYYTIRVKSGKLQLRSLDCASGDVTIRMKNTTMEQYASPDGRYLVSYTGKAFKIYDCKVDKVIRSGSYKMPANYNLFNVFVTKNYCWCSLVNLDKQKIMVCRFPLVGELKVKKKAELSGNNCDLINASHVYYVRYSEKGETYLDYSFSTGKSKKMTKNTYYKAVGLAEIQY